MQIRVKILSNFSIFTGIKIGCLPEIVRFLMLLLTDVDNKKKSICYTGDSLNSKKEKKLIDCGVRNGLQRIM